MTKITVKQMIKIRKNIANGGNSKHAKKVIRRTSIRGWAFVAPGIIWTTIFVVIAAGIAFYLIGQQGSISNMTKSTKSNFSRLFANDYYSERLKNAFITSIKFTVISSLLGIGGALVLATLLNTTKVRGKNIYMGFLFLPQVTSIVASGLIFSKIFESTFGWNYYSDPTKVVTVSIILYIWLNIAMQTVIYNTAFTAIDKTQYENAKIEGSGMFNTFFKITIPNLSNILMYALFTSLIGGLAVFDAPFVIGGKYGIVPEKIETVAFYGYSFVLSTSGQILPPNVGLAMAILTTLSVVMFTASILVNKIQPISKRRM